MFASAVTVPDELELTLARYAATLKVSPAEALQVLIRERLMEFQKLYQDNAQDKVMSVSDEMVQMEFDKINRRFNSLFRLKLVHLDGGATVSYRCGELVVNGSNPHLWTTAQLVHVMETLMTNAVKAGNIRP